MVPQNAKQCITIKKPQAMPGLQTGSVSMYGVVEGFTGEKPKPGCRAQWSVECHLNSH